MSESLRRAARLGLAAVLALGIAVPAMAVATPASALEPSPFTAFDNLPDPQPASTPSFGFQARSAREIGDMVRLAPGQRVLDDVTVLMNSWACESGTAGSGCTTTPGSTFAHPITLNIRSVSGPDAAPVLGPVVYTQTETFDIPFRPSSDPTNCPSNPTTWFAPGGTVDVDCSNGFAFPITFTAATDEVLPDRVVWSVEYDTSNHGYTPIGSPCVVDTNCGYDSLNVGLSNPPTIAGQNTDPSDMYLATTYPVASEVCDNGTNDGDFRRVDGGTCWTGLQPMARINTRDTGVSSETVTVTPNGLGDWTYIQEKPTSALLPPEIGVPPVASPLGSGAARLQVVDGEGKAWMNPSFDGTRLDAITDLTYSFITDNDGFSPTLSFDIHYRPSDVNWAGRLVYEPYYSIGTPDLAVGTWTEVDALSGTWWATKTTGEGSAGECAPAGASSCTWDEVLALFPDATIGNPTGSDGNLQVKLGSTGTTDGWFDGLTVGVAQPDGSVEQTTFDFEPQCSDVCYVSTTGDDGNIGSTAAEPLLNIQTAVDLVDDGGTVHIASGTYAEDVTIGKSLELLGADASTTTIEGPIGGPMAGIAVNADGVVIEGLTVTRAGNNPTDWNNAALNTYGVLVQASDVEIRDSIITGNRTGIDVRNGTRTGVSIHNNVISSNRSGMLLWGSAPDLEVFENSITGNHTMGILFQDDPIGDFSSAAFANNDLSGNWYGAVVNRHDPAHANSEPVDFSGNYFGPGEVTFTTSGSNEPGYASLVPAEFGGTATAPTTPEPYLAGLGSVSVDFTPYLDTDTDTDVDNGTGTFGFQGDFASLTVTLDGFQVQTIDRIREGVDAVDAGGTVHVAPGIYDVARAASGKSAIPLTKAVSVLGPNAGISPNDPTDPEQPNPARVPEAIINATDFDLTFGVNADDVTIDGFTFTDDAAGTTVSHAQSPIIGGGSNYSPGSNGPGYDGSASNATIVNNIFDQPSRVAVFFNGGKFVTGMTVDDNRVQQPTSIGVCASTCGRGMFNLWKVEDLSFSGNVVLGTPSGTTPYWVLNLSPGTGNTTTDVVVADNTIRNGCDDKCVVFSAGVDHIDFSGNDIADVEGERIIEFYQPSSGTTSQWTGGTVDIAHNVLEIAGGPAIAIDNPTADVSGITINRNALLGGGIDNTTPDAVTATCNYWGDATGPAGSQLNGPATTDPFLTTDDLDGACNAPTNVTATAGQGEATVSWTAPDAQGGASAVTGYTVTSDPDGQTCTTTGATACAVTGLTAGTEYTFTVTATHGSTTSGPSAPSNPVTPTGVPKAPLNVVATSKVESAKIAWDAPASDGGSAITGYTVTAAPGGATCTTNGALTCTVNNLTAGTEYTFAVTATNAIGTGPAETATATPTGPHFLETSHVVVECGVAQVTLRNVSPWIYPVSYTVDGGVANGGTEGYGPVVDNRNGAGAQLDQSATKDFTFPDGSGTHTITYVVKAGTESDLYDGLPVGTVTSFDVEACDVPSEPLDVVATALDGGVSLTWAAPTSDGGTPITGYSLTTLDGKSCSTSTLACIIDGLQPGTTHGISVAAINRVGTGPAATIEFTTPEVPEPPTATPDYNPVGPLRWFDTRGESNPVLADVPNAQIGGGQELKVNLFAAGGDVPTSNVGAVSLNVTATNTSGPGYITVYPCGNRGEVSNVNFTGADQSVASAVVTPIGANGDVCFYSLVDADLVVDINGTFIDDERAFTPVDPVRLFDTRGDSADALVQAPEVPVAPLAAGGMLEVDLSGVDILPAVGTKGVSLSVTVTETSDPGYVTVYDCDSRADVSSVNFSASHQTVANSVITPVSADGTVCFYASVETELIVDVNGFVPIDSTFESVSPVRVFDTRGESPDALRTVPVGPIGGATEVKVQMTDLGSSVPATGVGSVSLNVTATQTTAPGYITVYACGQRDEVSSVNYFGADQTVANAVIAPVSASGEVCFYALTDAHVVVDLNGWTSSTPYQP